MEDCLPPGDGGSGFVTQLDTVIAIASSAVVCSFANVVGFMKAAGCFIEMSFSCVVTHAMPDDAMLLCFASIVARARVADGGMTHHFRMGLMDQGCVEHPWADPDGEREKYGSETFHGRRLFCRINAGISRSSWLGPEGSSKPAGVTGAGS